MTIGELRNLIAEAPDDAQLVVVTDVLEGTTEKVYDGDFIDVLYEGRPYVQIVLDSAFERTS